MLKGINRKPIGFAIIFLSMFALFYFFNLFFIGLTAPGNHYNAFIDRHLNYVRGLRILLIYCSAHLLSLLNFTVLSNEFQLMVVGRGIIRIVYTCLGLGLMSFFAAFVIAFPKKLKDKMIFLLAGLTIIQLLNVLRFVLLVLFWKKNSINIVDHHTIFNLIIYLLIAISLYVWIRNERHSIPIHAKN